MQIHFAASCSICVIAVAMTACSGGEQGDDSASLESAARKTSGAYLALGDSIAFGDNGYVPWESPLRENDDAFVGYPSTVARILYGSESAVTNLGCPGETTGSFLDATAPDNGCRDYKGRSPSQLHVPYAGTQMSAALEYIANHKVSLITMTVGANDLLLANYACAATTDFTSCVAAALPGAIANAATNVGKIMATLRHAGYAGDVVFVTQYVTNYTDTTFLTAITLLDSAVAAAVTAYGGKTASGLDAFALASVSSGGDACKAGLLVPNPDGTPTCDKHPSAKGRALLGGIAALAH
jgi:hypothetical protein